jgi:hypothetical protein
MKLRNAFDIVEGIREDALCRSSDGFGCSKMLHWTEPECTSEQNMLAKEPDHLVFRCSDHFLR